MKPVSDPILLEQLNGSDKAPVTDPAVIAQLESSSPLDKAIGIADAGATLVSGAVAEPVAGIAGLLSIPVKKGEAGEVVESVRDTLTHDPATEEGRNNLKSLAKQLSFVTDMLERAEKASGDFGYDLAGPIGGALASTLPAATLELLGLKGAKAISKAAPERIGIEDASTPSAVKDTVSQIAENNPAKTAELANPDPALVSAANELQIEPIASGVSQNRAFIDAEQATKSRPGSQLAAKEQKSITDLQDRADSLIEDLGGNTDKSLLDAQIREDFNASITDLSDRSRNLSSQLDAIIPKDQPLEPSAVRSYLDGKLAELGGDKSLLAPVERKLLVLTKEGAAPTYAAIDRVRRDVGSGFQKTGPYKDTDSAILSEVYGVLADDQKAVAAAFDAVDLLEQRNALVVKRKNLEDQSIAAFGKSLDGSIVPATRRAATGLIKGDVSGLNKLLEAVPEGRKQDVAVAVLQDIFNSGARTAPGLGQGFVNAYAGFNRNATAKAELFKYLPGEAQRRFDLIGKVATGIYRSKALENNSKTARDILAALDDPSWLAKAYNVGKRGALAESATTAVGVPGLGVILTGLDAARGGGKSASKAADDLLSSERFARAVKEAAISNSRKADEALQKTPAFKRWAQFVSPGDLSEISTRGFVPWLLLTPRSVEQSSSEQEKAPPQ